MLLHLDVPFLDASADQLVWRFGAPPQPCLATLEVVVGGGLTLELRLLGASHQVLARGADGAMRCSEVVACGAAAGGLALPPAVEREDGGLRYRFTSEVRRVDDATLAATADELLRRPADDGVLVGAFPGSPLAVTAIEAQAAGWRTWHLYPQTGEIVTTATRLLGRR